MPVAAARSPSTCTTRSRTIIGGLIAILTFLGVSRLSPIRDLDLTIWIKQEIPLTLPTNAPLTLTYSNFSVGSATILEVCLTNCGSKQIAESGPTGAIPWQLTLKSKDAKRITLVSPPQVHPGNLDLKPQAFDSNRQDSLSFEMGLFKPGEGANLRLLIIDPKTVEHPELTGETTRNTPNVPNPRVTRTAPATEGLLYYQNPLFIIFTVAFAAFFIFIAIRDKMFHRDRL